MKKRFFIIPVVCVAALLAVLLSTVFFIKGVRPSDRKTLPADGWEETTSAASTEPAVPPAEQSVVTADSSPEKSESKPEAVTLLAENSAQKPAGNPALSENSAPQQEASVILSSLPENPASQQEASVALSALSENSVPQYAEPAPATAQSENPAAQPQDSTPQTQETAPEAQNPAPETPDPTPQPQAPTPEPQDSTPQPQDPTPQPQEPAPEPQDPTPQPQEPAPEPQDPTPQPQEPAPEPQDPTPQPQEPAPEPQDPTPQPQEPAPEPQDPTPEPETTPVPAAMEPHNGQDLGYWLYTPENPSANMPLIVYLHGGSGKGEDLDRLIDVDGFPKWLYDGSLGTPSAYILIPQLPSDLTGWSDAGSSVIALMDEIIAAYGIDPDHISLTGHSMGGTGTFALAQAYPDRFARIAPCSGSIRITAEDLVVFRDIAVWAFVGSADTIIDPKSSIYFVNRLSQIGDARLTQFDGATHFDVPALVYRSREINLVSWLIGE